MLARAGAGGLPPAPAVCHHLHEMQQRCVGFWFLYGGHDPA
jgi:hypothetical protein